MKILVTGISGFIGSHLAAALAALGHDVTGTYRNNQPRLVKRYEKGFLGSAPKKGSIQSVRAELSDKDTVRTLVQGMDGVIHIAGHVSDWGSKEHFYKANVLPLQHFIEQFQSSSTSLQFFIHTSSVSVHGFGEHRASTEEGPYYHLRNHYQKSKYKSEEILLSQAMHASEPVIGIIRPGNVYGPGDTTFLYPVLDALKTGKFVYVDQGHYLTCPIFIDDLVAAYLALLGKLVTAPTLVHGRIYNITSNETITWKDMLEASVSTANIQRPKYSVPKWFAFILASLVTGLFKLLRFKKGPKITTYRVSNVSNNYNFSVSRAIRELGWSPATTFTQGIVPSVKAWKEYEGT